MAILILVVAIGLILHNRSILLKEKKNRDLKEECARLNKIVERREREDGTSSSINNTSFIASKMKTQETLQAEIDKLKTKVENTKKIAQDASMIKIDFLTNVRHEIRTPMNSILVFAQMIESESPDKRLATFANNIVHSGNNLLNLFNNIIELSEIESGSFEINKSAVDIRNLIYLITESYKRQAMKKGLVLKVEIDKTIPESIMIDHLRVKEILNNLI
jgi:two-component system chemotaxis sensor kinase CheA